MISQRPKRELIGGVVVVGNPLVGRVYRNVKKMNRCALSRAQKEAEKVALYLHTTALVLFTILSRPVLYTLLLMAIQDVARSSLLPTHIKL